MNMTIGLAPKILGSGNKSTCFNKSLYPTGIFNSMAAAIEWLKEFT